jgi:DNA polymerase-3 subunit epsilon
MFEWLRNRQRQAVAPDFWRAYEASFHHRPERKQPIEAVSFVVFDTETTGLDTRKDRILSIGAVRIEQWAIDLSASFERLVNQERRNGGRESIPIHGILPVERPEGLNEEQAVQAFLGYIGNSVLVGHHVLFDISMINEALRRMGLGKLKNRYLDTARLALRLQRGPYQRRDPYPGLDQLCDRYGILPEDRHTAAGDAFLTALVFLKMLGQLKGRGVRNLGDLLR